MVVGLRPHHLHPCGASERALGTLHFDAFERLGGELLAHGWARASGANMVIRLEGDAMRKAVVGDAMEVAIDPERLHFFDAASGLRLESK